jgi:hypothetical protein
MNANQNGEDLEEKKLLGSGGHAFAKLTEQEEIKALGFLIYFWET